MAAQPGLSHLSILVEGLRRELRRAPDPAGGGDLRDPGGPASALAALATTRPGARRRGRAADEAPPSTAAPQVVATPTETVTRAAPDPAVFGQRAITVDADIVKNKPIRSVEVTCKIEYS